MKITLILVVTVLCGVWGESTVPPVTVTTPRPWTQRFRDGLDKFFAGVAVATSVQNALHNGKGKNKLAHHDPVHNKNSHTSL